MFLELRTKKAVIAVGVVYLVSGLGVCGENVNRLQGVSEFLGTLSVPWVLMGDFNVSAGDLDLSGFPRLARGRVLVPSMVEFTCTQGRGSLIDYVVASEDIASYVRVSKYTPSPFKTHACLKVSLDHGAVEQTLWKRVKPPPFPDRAGPDLPWEVVLTQVSDDGDLEVPFLF
jgi:hypothetical protein